MNLVWNTLDVFGDFRTIKIFSVIGIKKIWAENFFCFCVLNIKGLISSCISFFWIWYKILLRGIFYQYPTGCWLGGWLEGKRLHNQYPTGCWLGAWRRGFLQISNWFLVGWDFPTNIQLVAGWMGGYLTNIQLFAGYFFFFFFWGGYPTNIQLVAGGWGVGRNHTSIQMGGGRIPYQYTTDCWMVVKWEDVSFQYLTGW